MAIDTQNLWDNYNGKGFAAEYSKYSVRASKDEAGQDIHSTLTNLDSRTSVIPAGEASATSSLTVTNSGSTWANWGEGEFEIPPEPNVVTIGNRKYRTVTIGQQEWLAENLDFIWDGLAIQNGMSNENPYANYYDQNAVTYKKYGLYYNQNAVIDLESKKSTLLPSGWHVPTYADFEVLMTEVGGPSIAGKMLKAETGWNSGNGSDDYGFSLLPSGQYNSSGWNAEGTFTRLWSVSVSSGTSNYTLDVGTENSVMLNYQSGFNKHSVRLVKTLS